MNCLILVLLLLCGQNSGNWFDNGCNNDCGCRNDRRGREGRNGGGCNSGCGNERRDDDDCGCRNDFRSESRFEQRPFVFNQNPGCGCEESQNSNCDR